MDEDSLPLHVLGVEPLEQQLLVGQFVVGVEERLEAYGGTFAALHPAAWKEVKAMAKTKRRGLDFDLSPIVEELGLERVIEKIGKKKVIEHLRIKDIMANLTQAQRRELRRQLDTEAEGEKE